MNAYLVVVSVEPDRHVIVNLLLVLVNDSQDMTGRTWSLDIIEVSLE